MRNLCYEPQLHLQTLSRITLHQWVYVGIRLHPGRQQTGCHSEDSELVAILTPSPTNIPTDTSTPAPPTATFSPTTSPTITLTPTQTVPPGIPYARINDITIDDANYYVVEYETFEFIEQISSSTLHVHFFFDTVTPEQAGVPGSGLWILYGGPRPFTGYTVSAKPAEATEMCVLVANPNHSIQMGSGMCFLLPEEPAP